MKPKSFRSQDVTPRHVGDHNEREKNIVNSDWLIFFILTFGGFVLRPKKIRHEKQKSIRNPTCNSSHDVSWRCTHSLLLDWLCLMV